MQTTPVSDVPLPCIQTRVRSLSAAEKLAQASVEGEGKTAQGK